MDIMTGVGLVCGIIVVSVMIFMGGDLHMFISEHAALIVIGGSIAATMIRFPLSAILHGLPLGAKFAFTISRL
ncbi:MAG TPA: flagellar motor protein PomA, partial [Bradyrhizobium sp.]|nr:flagellar motor protein PomA [Bradyrhizobium sp.]